MNSGSEPQLTLDIATLARRVLKGNRRALAQAITLIESTRHDHRIAANDLLQRLIPNSGKAIRLGISGVPGVGKSTFVEALGNHVIDEGHRVAVLTVDPSSAVSGGSILGDTSVSSPSAKEASKKETIGISSPSIQIIGCSL